MFARGHYRLYNDILLVTVQRTGFIKRLKENMYAKKRDINFSNF
jgi:hypothetical protein